MANLVISTVCNQECVYCFTVDHREQRRADGSRQEVQHFLPIKSLEERLDFLNRSGVEEIRLLGGEPTLHPHFVALVDRARTAGKRIIVFTNGLMPPSALACLVSLPPQECSVVVNVNEPDPTGNRGTYKRQLGTIRRLGERATPGFNIYRPDFQLEFLLDLVADSGCNPYIRLSMAQPCLSGSNRYIHPNQYRAVAVKITRFAQAAANSGVTLGFDCGFVRCMFSSADLDTLRAAGARVGWHCSPILDVDIEGNVIHCFPLSRLMSLPLLPTVDTEALQMAFLERTRAYREVGVFPECSTCPFKMAGKCTGGCLAATILRFRHTAFSVEVPNEWGSAA